jgi:hypothetical protein
MWDFAFHSKRIREIEKKRVKKNHETEKEKMKYKINGNV